MKEKREEEERECTHLLCSAQVDLIRLWRERQLRRQKVRGRDGKKRAGKGERMQGCVGRSRPGEEEENEAKKEEEDEQEEEE